MLAAIVLPTYNEIENIERLLNSLVRLKGNFKVIVVDDNSPDGTGKLVEKIAKRNKKVVVLHRKKKMGLGSAYIAGFDKAKSLKAQVILTMDADLSHNPKVIPLMVKKLEQFDVVIGSRHIKGGKIIGFDIFRHTLSRFAQMFSRNLLGIPVYDSSSGFRAYRVKVLEDINPKSIKSQGYSFLIEMIYKISKRGYRICEIPITFEARTKGKSKLSNQEIYKALKTVWRLKTYSES